MIDSAFAGSDPPVQPDALTSRNDEAVAWIDLGHRHVRFRSVCAQETHHGRRKIDKSGNGTARSADAPAFEGEREGEQEGDRRCLEPFADDDGAGDGDRHQKVHVGPQAERRVPGLDDDEANAEADGERIGRHLGQRHGFSVVTGEKPNGFGEAAREPNVDDKACNDK